MKTIMKGASILMAIFMFSMVLTPVFAAPPLPFERSGTADVSSGDVTSWINGVEYASYTLTDTNYILETVGDDTGIVDNTRTGGVAGDTIQYAQTHLTGATATIFTQTDTWVAGGVNSPAALTSGATLNLLKIAIVSQNSGLAVTDYIAIYNPTGGAVDVTGYSLAVGNGAASAIVAGDIPTGLVSNGVNPIPATDYLYIDMAGWGGLGAANSIQLSTAGFIVDRVEYGAIAAEPENTIMGNAASPGAGQEIYRTPALGTDTNDCSADFATRAASIDIDTTAPTSAVNAIAAWFTTSPQTVTATASDADSGVASVELFYGAGVSFGVDGASPWSWSFNFPTGEGSYDLYTRATDNAANVEAAGGVDTWIGYDATNPVAGAGADMNIIVPTQKNDATATDATSGVDTTVWTYPANVICSNDNILNPTFSASADGVYTVTLTVTDVAGNTHQDTFQLTWSTPADPTATATGPTSAWTNVAGVTVTYTTTDSPDPVYLYYSTNGGTTWTLIGTDSPADGSYAWTIPADGVYDFLAACDNPTDPLPTGGEAVEAGTYNYDGTNPVAAAGADMTISTPTQKTDASATDALSGVASILWTYPANVICSNDAIINPTFSASATGVYTVTLTVTDNAGNTHQDTFQLDYSIGGTTTSWDMYNGQNYRTFSSTLNGGWMASNLAMDVIATINADHGEDLTEVDVTVTMYDTFSGAFTTCYFLVGPNFWLSDFALAEGEGYIVNILNLKLDSQPLAYELPNFEISSAVSVDLYNGANYRGFPVSSSAMASNLAMDVIAYINGNYGEDLTEVDVTVTMYDTFSGAFTTCYFLVGPNFWLSDFAIDPTNAYIVNILNLKLDSQPLTYIPS